MTAIWHLLRTNWRLKLAVTALVNLLFWVGYGFLGRWTFLPIRDVPLTPLDRAVPYSPEPWGWIYFSAYAYTAFLPWLLTRGDQLRRYSVGLATMALISFAIFFLFPTASPRPAELGDSWPMQLIHALDGPYNAFPSLHAGFIIFMGMLAWRMFGPLAPRLTFWCASAWGLAVFYSTLATKQHYVLDLIAGGVIGAFADRLAWRGSDAAAMIPRMSESAPHSGAR